MENNKQNINKVLRVLSLEDSYADFVIISQQLLKAGYDLDISQVVNKSDFEISLRNEIFDIILVDFNLPGFNAFGALQMCNEICPGTPFICVSGSIGEETAIDLLKLGAVDYVLKDRPERLPFAIKRALDEVKDKEIHGRTEIELRKLSRAVEQSPVSIIITNPKGEIEYVNKKFTEITGYPKEESISKNPRFLKSGHQDTVFYENLWNTILSGKEWTGELLNKKKNGELFWEAAQISPMVDKYGNITNYVAFKEDITGKKKIIEELILAKDHAEESDRLKSAFLSNMSHEIRTPMNGIVGFTDLLKEPNLSGEQQQEYIGIIEKSCSRLLNIINDIVDISKIESGMASINIQETNINEKIEFIYKFFKPEVEQKGIKLFFTKALPSKESIIQTDKEKIIAILTNLVKNAIKFTIAGSIEFGYSLKSKSELANPDSNQDVLEFFVKDTGIGIPIERQDAIFERFVQADIEDHRAFQGAGLGLSISKAYVEMLGGKIRVKSNEGDGSSFYFTIPYILATKKKLFNESSDIKENESYGDVVGLNVLIVDDDLASGLLLRNIVKKFSKEILLVMSGSEAIDECLNNPDIDLVMMDIKLPDMDGYEATRQIRKFNSKVFIIAQTAFAFIGDREKAIEAGCNEYFAKPLNRDKLLDLINRHFNS